MEEYEYTTVSANDLRITSHAAGGLRNISKWTKFLSILGFIVIALIIIGILGVGTLITSVNHYELSQSNNMYTPGTFSWLYAGLYILLLLVYAVPFYYLYKFSQRINTAVNNNDVTSLNEASYFLEKHFMFIGILAILWLIIMVFTVIIMVITMSALM